MLLTEQALTETAGIVCKQLLLSRLAGGVPGIADSNASEIANRAAESSRREWEMYFCKAADPAFARKYRSLIGDKSWHQNWIPKSSAGLNPRGLCCCRAKLTDHFSARYPNPMEYVSGSVVNPARAKRERMISNSSPPRTDTGNITSFTISVVKRAPGVSW